MGVCSHSSPEFWDEFVIFAVGDGDVVVSNFKEFCKAIVMKSSSLEVTNLRKELGPLDLRLSLLSLGDCDDHVVSGSGQDDRRLGHLVQYVLHVANLDRGERTFEIGTLTKKDIEVGQKCNPKRNSGHNTIRISWCFQ